MMEKRYTKANLPEKICAACSRPFVWRKKWARDWDNVKTCSERCKRDLRLKKQQRRPFLPTIVRPLSLHRLRSASGQMNCERNFKRTDDIC